MLPNDRPSLVRSVLHLWHRSGLKKKITCIVYAVLWMDYSTPVVVRCCICDVLYACRSAWAMAWKSLKPQRPISDPKTAHSGVVGTFYRTPGFPGGVKSFLVVIDSPHSHFRRRFGWDFRRWPMTITVAHVSPYPALAVAPRKQARSCKDNHPSRTR